MTLYRSVTNTYSPVAQSLEALNTASQTPIKTPLLMKVHPNLAFHSLGEPTVTPSAKAT